MQTNVTLPDEKQGARPPGKAPSAGTKKTIHQNSFRTPTADSPFQEAKSLDKRLKLFLWGDSGVHKTILSIQFPKPVVIDLERGTDLYSDSFEFDVRHATTADEVMEGVEWLLTHPHPYRTIVIDPITVYWEALQKKWSDIFLMRNKGSKGYKFEFYDLQPRDWMTIKAELKDLLRKLAALDMNIIVTARQKVEYADGAFMKAIGQTFDGEKSLPYFFDTIVRLYRDERGRFMGECLKDRAGKLPLGEFEASYEHFEKFFGKKALTRKARPTAFATEEQKEQIRHYIEQIGVTPDQLARRLAAYNAESLDELTHDNAQIIIEKLESALAAKTGAGQSTREV